MHDVLEGCLAYEVKELLKHIVNTRLLSLSELDNIIQSFPYLGLDRQNKPSPILYPHLITASGKLVGLHVHTYSTLICCTSNQVINTLYTCLVINLPVHTYTILTLTFILLFLATQMWCLGRLLPLMIGERIPEDSDHWLNFLHLRTIMDYLLAPVLSPECIEYIKVLIQEHHEMWKELYPNCRITPKMHYFIHYPESIQKYVAIHNCTCMCTCISTSQPP